MRGLTAVKQLCFHKPSFAAKVLSPNFDVSTCPVAGKVLDFKSDVLRYCLQVQQVLTSSNIDSGRTGPSAESKRPEPEQERLLEELEQQPLNRESQAQSMPLVEPSAWRPDPLLEKPEGISPPHSEPGRQSFGDRDGAESWATVRTTRDSFETASTSHQHTQERSMSECSDRDDRQPVLTGEQTCMRMLLPLSCCASRA